MAWMLVDQTAENLVPLKVEHWVKKRVDMTVEMLA
jgi:hypothetical protein